jgi:hypothetical protein
MGELPLARDEENRPATSAGCRGIRRRLREYSAWAEHHPHPMTRRLLNLLTVLSLLLCVAVCVLWARG